MNTETPPSQAEKPAKQTKRLPLGRVGTGLTLGGLVLALGVGGLYLGRRAVAEEVLVGWLQRRGISAEVQVQKLEWDGFSGRILVGNPNDPDVRVERVDVDYLIGLPWMKDGFGLTPKRVILSRPVIKAEWTGEKLSFGSLDPLIEELTSRPPGTKPGPVVVVENGQGLITTPYGAISLSADARLNDSRLEWLKATLNPASLTLDDMRAEGVGLTLEATSTADTLTFKGQAVAGSVSTPQTTGHDLVVNLSGNAPYPAKSVTAAKGPVRLLGDVSAARLEGEALSGRNVRSRLEWSGMLDGWVDKFVLGGKGSWVATADNAAGAGHTLSGLDIAARDMELTFSRGQKDQTAGRVYWAAEGPLYVQADGLSSDQLKAANVRLGTQALSINGVAGQFETRTPLTLTADSLTSGDLHLQQVRSEVSLDVSRGTATRIGVQGGLNARGRFDGLGPVKSDDVPEMVRLKQAAQSFELSAPSVAFVQNNHQGALQLEAPATVRSANGARLTLEALGGPLLQMTGGSPFGAARLKVEGEGLPDLGIDISRWQIVNGGLNAQLSGEGRMDFTPVSGIAVKTSGQLSVINGATRFVANNCATVQARQVNIGENNLEALSGQLCPDGQPMFSVNQGAWALAGRLKDTTLKASFLEAGLDSGSARLKVSGRNGDLALSMTQIDAMLRDLSSPDADSNEDAPPLRFNALEAKGDVSLRGGIWNGSLDLFHEATKIGNLKLDHSNSSQSGRLQVATENLTFMPGVLQPSDISPLLSTFMTNADGRNLSMSGDIVWTAQGVQSGGQVYLGDVERDALGRETGGGLSFDTPAGRLEGVSGTIKLIDLLSPTTDGTRTVRARRLNSFMPFEDLTLNLSLDDRVATISDAGLSINGARITATRIMIPLDGSNTLAGELYLERVQINDILQAAKLGDKIQFQAEVSGAIGFTYDPRRGWQIRDSKLAASSGRLSVNPDVLHGVATEGAELNTDLDTAVPVPPNAMQDLAYQALENLAIEDMEATVESLPNGRLAINFLIDGRHDPPERKELRVPLIDFIRGTFMQRKLDLPSSTPVTLKLNTSWNANEIATSLYQIMQKRFDQLETSDPVGASSTGSSEPDR